MCGCVCMAANEIDVLCADLIVLAFIVLAFCIFNPYCCDFCAAFRRNKE